MEMKIIFHGASEGVEIFLVHCYAYPGSNESGQLNDRIEKCAEIVITNTLTGFPLNGTGICRAGMVGCCVMHDWVLTY